MADKADKAVSYIALARVSTQQQIGPSIVDQFGVIHEFGDHQQWQCRGEEAEEGVSGSIPGGRDVFDRLIERKIKADDFDAIVVHDFSRFTRAGSDHDAVLRHELQQHGIEVLSATEPLPEGLSGELIRNVKAFANQQFSVSLALNSSRGTTSAIKDKRIPASRRPPYGVERQIVDQYGSPLYRVREQDDDTYVLLHPLTGEALRSLGIDPKTKKPVHYKLQKNERSCFVPGPAERVRAVNDIFEMYLVKGMGVVQIKRVLDERGIAPPRGKKWDKGTILNIVRNPVYVGMARHNWRSSAIYAQRTDASPVLVDSATRARRRDRICRKGTKRKRPVSEIRPAEEWRFQEQDGTKDFLSPELREAAVVFQEDYREKFPTGRKLGETIGPPKRESREYPLQGMIRSHQYGDYLKGHCCGDPPNYHYTYISALGKEDKAPRGTLRKSIPAEEAEGAVLNVVRRMVCGLPDIEGLVERFVREQFQHRRKNSTKLGEMRAELANIKREIREAMRFRKGNRRTVDELVDELETQRANIEEQIHETEQIAPLTEQGIENGVREVVAELNKARVDLLAAAEIGPVRRLLESLIRRMEFDHKTCILSDEMALPIELSGALLRVGKPRSLDLKTTRFAHEVQYMPLGLAVLVLEGKPAHVRIDRLVPLFGPGVSGTISAEPSGAVTQANISTLAVSESQPQEDWFITSRAG